METAQQNEIRKPVGVYILTICIFLRFGVFQFINDFNAIRDSDSSVPFLITIILIGRNVLVAGAAVWAFVGENEGRIALLAIVSLNVLWSIFNFLTFASYHEYDVNTHAELTRLLNPVFWLAVCWWYLNRRNVVKYYKRNE
jgi:hypothetical protein